MHFFESIFTWKDTNIYCNAEVVTVNVNVRVHALNSSVFPGGSEHYPSSTFRHSHGTHKARRGMFNS